MSCGVLLVLLVHATAWCMWQQQLTPAGSGTALGQKGSATQMLCEWGCVSVGCAERAV
jgi:hypothetical protein